MHAKIKITPSLKYGTGIYIDLISTPEDSRQQGHASNALVKMIEIADKNDVMLVLSPDSLGQGLNNALSQESLEAWYKRHGFRPHVASPRDWVRYPQTSTK